LYNSFVNINLKNLVSNYKYIYNQSKNVNVLGVVKANAYGHGLEQVAKTLDQQGIYGLGVATANEIRSLIDLNLKAQIIHLGSLHQNDYSLLKHDNVVCTIHSIEEFNNILNYVTTNNLQVKAHIKIDTGMHRLGVLEENIKLLIEKIINNNQITIEGLYTHFSSAIENVDIVYKQFDKFELIKKIFIEKIKTIKYFHAANSATILKHQKIKLNVIRPGITLYGISPFKKIENHLKPVMSFFAPVVLIKTIRKGMFIGYSQAYEAKKDMRIAIIQAGYADGVPFESYQNGCVFWEKNSLKILGKISMDLTCVDISNYNINIGDQVLFWGESQLMESRLEKISKNIKKIPYLLLTGISKRVIRKYV